MSLSRGRAGGRAGGREGAKTYLDAQASGAGGDGVGEASRGGVIGVFVKLVAEKHVVEPVQDHGGGAGVDLRVGRREGGREGGKEGSVSWLKAEKKGRRGPITSCSFSGGGGEEKEDNKMREGFKEIDRGIERSRSRVRKGVCVCVCMCMCVYVCVRVCGVVSVKPQN